MFSTNARRHLFWLTLTTTLSTGALISSAQAQQLQGENLREATRVIAPQSAALDDTKNKILHPLAQPPEGKNRMTAMFAEGPDPLKVFKLWHEISLDVAAEDYISKPLPNGQQKNLEQFGPPRTSYAFALIHLAMFEVANAYASGDQKVKKTWLASHMKKGTPLNLSPPHDSDESAAITEAAFIMMTHLYPNLTKDLAPYEQQALAGAGGGPNGPTLVENGKQFGAYVANAILYAREGDNSTLPDQTWGVDFKPLEQNMNRSFPPGQWQPDPVAQQTLALGANWGKVTPFIVISPENYPERFREKFPLPDIKEYLKKVPLDRAQSIFKAAFEQVYYEGGDRDHYHITRYDTKEQDRYYHAKYWAYDGTPGVCAPVRLYNQIAGNILDAYAAGVAPDYSLALRGKATAVNKVAAVAEVARYYAILNTTMADAAIVGWYFKYKIQYWRPVTGIRYVQNPNKPDPSTKAQSTTAPVPYLPAATITDIPSHPIWFPLGAQTTNSAAGYNVTPPFPAYPSGHAVFGGAFFQALRRLIPNDQGFSHQSDEFNYKNVDAFNFIRCVDDDKSTKFCGALNFSTFTQAEIDNALSRVYNGVHWNFDASCGDDLGEKIGDATIDDDSFKLDNERTGPHSAAKLKDCIEEGAKLQDNDPYLHEPAPPPPLASLPPLHPADPLHP